MKKQKKNTHHLLRLAAFAKPYFSWYVLIFITMFMTTVVVLLRPKIIQVLIDDHLSPLASGVLPQAVQDAHLSQALLLGLLYLGTIVFHFVVMYAYDFLTMRTGTLIVTDMRQKIYEHVLRLPMRYFDHHAIGSLYLRADQFIPQSRPVFGRFSDDVFSGCASGLFYLPAHAGGNHYFGDFPKTDSHRLR